MRFYYLFKFVILVYLILSIGFIRSLLEIHYQAFFPICSMFNKRIFSELLVLTFQHEFLCAMANLCTAFLYNLLVSIKTLCLANTVYYIEQGFLFRLKSQRFKIA